MQYLLFEDESHDDLLPLTFTRPVHALRVGILQIHEKWVFALGSPVGSFVRGYLAPKFSTYHPEQEAIFINGKFLPTASFAEMLRSACEPGHFLLSRDGELLAFRCIPSILPTGEGPVTQAELIGAGLRPAHVESIPPPAIRFPWDIFRHNGAAIRSDFEWVVAKQERGELSDPHTIVYGRDNIFIAPGAKIRAAILNAEEGPIYIGAGAEIQEGAIVHGTHAIGANSTVNMGAKLRGDTTVGPWSKVGGEIANSVIQGFSNKGHDGYLGNSVLGEWCNLGADTNTSNLKNNYTEVRVWNYKKRSFVRTGQLFCGLIMGDHSKCGINTMFNTGTVVGVSANIFGAGYPRNFIPSFSWGGASGLTTFALKKAYEVAEAVMGRRKVAFDQLDKDMLAKVFELTAVYRNWERGEGNTTIEV